MKPARVYPVVLVVLSLAGAAAGADWARFRGPNGSGTSTDTRPMPVKWSESANLRWKAKLPGPGLSSPIVVGDRVFVTGYSGYGLDARDPGNQEDLKRHLVCFDRRNGKTIWSRAVDPVLPEDPYRGQFTQHGYASHTPVSDGKRIYVFFGKTGVLAFDMDGQRLWQTSVGTESDPRGWGSAASPILYKHLVIVNASAESEALVALDTETGKEVWRQEAQGFSGTWGSPILVDLPGGRTELVLAVPYEIWALNPDTGKLRWYCEGVASNSACASAITHDGIVYFVGGREGGSIAVRAGGKGDVTKTHVLWSGRDRARISSPVCHEGHIYWISNRIANCIDASTGERVYQSRLSGGAATTAASGRPGGEDRRERGFGGGRGGGGFGRFGGGRGGGRGGDYSSPVVADGKLYFVSRSGDMYVLALGDEFKELARNRFESDSGEFSASPAVSDGDLFIRSNNFLYCISESR